MLIDCFLDNAVELSDLATLLCDNILSFTLLLSLFLVTLLKGLKLFGLETILMMLSGKGLVLGVNLILKLSNLILGNTELLSQLNNLIVSDDQVLTVKVSVRSHNLIQVLLLLEFALELNILFLKLTNKVTLQLDLLNHLHEVGVGLVGSLRLLFLLSFNLSDRLDQTLDVILVAVVLFLKRADDLLLAIHSCNILLVVLLHLDKRGLEHVTVTLEFHDPGLLVICLLLEPVEVTEQVVHVALGVFFLVNRF